MRAFRIGFVLALSASSLAIFAQAPAPSAAPEITRADLASSYLRIEYALVGKKHSPEETAAMNTTFDQATLAFFQRKFADAIRQIDSITATVGGKDGDQEFLKKAAALRLRVEPTVVVAGSAAPVSLHIEQMYLPGEAGEPIEGRIEVRDRLGEVKASEDFKLRFEKDRPVELVMAIRGDKAGPGVDKKWFAEPGRYSLWIASDSFTRAQKSVASALPGPSGQYTVVAESLQAVSDRNATRLDAIRVSTPALEQTLASVKARNKLLSDAPNPENTAQYVLDPVNLSKEIAAEIGALEKGSDPFNARKGDYWRVLKTGDKEIPLRVYASAALDLAKPLPLIIAFHGAGGDENMFMDAYGAGRLKQLADEHKFLLVTPLTYSFGGATLGDSFDALLAAIGMNYSIDPKRIYVMGHSMGGGLTTSIVAARGAKIAAAAPICGFRGLPADTKDVPPMFVVAAELDPLATPKAVGPAAEAAKAAGFPVEYKMIPNYGHTLVVGEILPEAVAWMLAKAR